jgi:signal transduction histidine kinase
MTDGPAAARLQAVHLQNGQDMSNATRFLPRSFAAWALIIVVAAVIALEVVTLLVATYSVEDNLRTADLFRLAERISGVARAVSSQPTDKRRELIGGFQSAFLAVTVDDAPAVANIIADDDEMAELEDILTAKLATNGVTDLRIAEYDTNRLSQGQGLVLHGESGDEGIEADLAREAQNFGTSGYFTASMKMSDSDWINFIIRKSPRTTPLTTDNLYIYALVAAVPLIVCFWAVRQLVWPYRRLERAVRQLGEDLHAPPIVERGDYEVRSVIRAINAMQGRLKDYIAEREHLAAALAHDLRTPLTRMKIRLELIKSEPVQPLSSDIREIEHIVNSVLEFSRAESATAPRDKVDLASLVHDICDNYPEAAFATQLAGRRAVVRANTTFLNRAVTNLVENAIRHAATARVSIAAADGWATITVDDDGKGIPPQELENVVKPFYRVESSRNKDTGGTGLGLAITDSVARSHGGRLELANRPEGGLRARITLPLAEG